MSRASAVPIVLGAIVSLACAAAGVVLSQYQSDFRARARRTTGIVIENTIRARTAGVSAPNHYPVVKFRDATGQERTTTCVDCYTVGNSPQYADGERVTVLYDPDNPDHARIDSTFGRWGLPVLFAVGAVLGMVLLVLLPWRRWRRESVLDRPVTLGE